MATEDKLGELLGSLVNLSLGVFTIFVGTAANGLATMLLWNWFMTPLGAVHITFVLAMGVAMTWGFLSYQNPGLVEEVKKREVAERITRSVLEAAVSIMRPAAAIACGFAVHLMM